MTSNDHGKIWRLLEKIGIVADAPEDVHSMPSDQLLPPDTFNAVIAAEIAAVKKQIAQETGHYAVYLCDTRQLCRIGREEYEMWMAAGVDCILARSMSPNE